MEPISQKTIARSLLYIRTLEELIREKKVYISSQELAKITRLSDVQIRKDILTDTCKAQSGHPGGSLSATDVMVCLYFHKMRHNPKRPNDPNRDRFILSKGHAAPILYAALFRANAIKYNLDTLRKLNSPLEGLMGHISDLMKMQ